MTIRIDPELPLPPPLPPPPPLGGAAGALARAGPAGRRPFEVGGAGAGASGTERGGVGALRIAGSALAGDLRADMGPCANVVLAPFTLRRETLGPRGPCLEILLAAPRLPLVAVQWRSPAGDADALPRTVAFTLLPDRSELRYRAGGAGLAAAGPHDAKPRALVAASPTPVGWAVEPAAGGGLQVRVTFSGDAPRTLVFAGGADPGRTLQAAAHLGAHEAMAAREAERPSGDRLVARTGVPDVDAALAWAAFRLEQAVRFPEPPEGPDAVGAAVWSGLGAAAVGDPESGDLALAALKGGSGWARLAPGLEGPTETLSALLAARMMWCDGVPRPASALAGAGRREGAPQPPTSRSLPVVGALPAEEIDAVAVLRSLLDPEARGPLPLPERDDWPAPLRAWRAWLGPEPDEGWAIWRAAVDAGLRGGPAGRVTWDPVPPLGRRGPTPGTGTSWGATPGATWGAPGAGALLAGFAYGLLGIRPDAVVGRIGLSPRLPRHLTRFEVEGIPVGDARLRLAFEREGDVHRFRLAATAGRVPPMAVFQPRVAVERVVEVRVDGAPADLETERRGGRTQVRVQLPVDGERVVEVVGT